MPIKRDLRWFYPIDWKQLSTQVRFGRAGGACERCGRPHRQVVRCLPDGRWFDTARHGWRDGGGQTVPWPKIADVRRLRRTFVILATAHLDHDPGNNRMQNLRALCQRCHMLHDRLHHLAQRWVTYRRRRALGDLFLGAYDKVQPTLVAAILWNPAAHASRPSQQAAARRAQTFGGQPTLPGSDRAA